MHWFIGLHAFSFFIGSIPIGYVIARTRGVDIRSHGSGNTGATNVARALGKKAGIVTLFGDMLKGLLAVHTAYLLPAASQLPRAAFVEISCTLGFFAILGHCFSPFLRGKGGKGVATSLGVFVSLAPLETLICCVIFALAFWTSRYVSLGSVLSAAAMPLLIWGRNSFSPPAQPTLLLVSILSASLIVMRHRANLVRLCCGAETKFRSS